jgi:flagellar biosynthetic protein FliR
MLVPTHWIVYVVPGLLIATRLSGLMITVPFLGDAAIAPRVKAALVIGVTLLMLPLLYATLPRQAPLDWLGEGLSELVIGVFMGLAVRVVAEAVLLAGAVASFQLGLSLESSIDPTSGASTTVLATLHYLVVLYVFLQLGVHRWILLALLSSFRTLPLGSSLAPGSVHALFAFAGNLFVWGVELALPVLIATFLIDVTLAFFAKSAPQLPVIFIGIPVTELIGYGVLLAAMRYWPGLLAGHFQQALQFLARRAAPGS